MSGRREGWLSRANRRTGWAAVGTAAILSVGAVVLAGFGQDGPRDAAALYEDRCANCHDRHLATRAPAGFLLSRLSAAEILQKLQQGSMRAAARGLSELELGTLASHTARRLAGEPTLVRAEARCSPGPSSAPSSEGPPWNGWGADLANTRFQPAAAAGLAAGDVARLGLKWAFGFDGGYNAFGQPAVVGGRVYVGSDNGSVFSLDAVSGCVHWEFRADGAVRTAMVVAPAGTTGARAVYFGDQRGQAYAVELESGRLLWKVRLDSHETAAITGSPAWHDGRLYVPMSSLEEATAATPGYECCTFRGSVSAVDAGTGRVVWQTYAVPPPRPVGTTKAGTRIWAPSGVAIWSAPTLDPEAGVLYVATGDNYTHPTTGASDAVMAIDLANGRVRWTRQLTAGDAWTVGCMTPNRTNCPEDEGPDFDFGASPILVKDSRGRKRLVVGQKSGVVYALDPASNGRTVWEARVGQGGLLGGVQWGMASDGTLVVAAVSDAGLITQPGRPPRVDPRTGGALVALRVDDGREVWRAAPKPCPRDTQCSPGLSAAVTAIPGIVFSGSLTGHLRAHSTEDGRVVWEVDTARPFDTVNGVTGHGGSIDGPGPVVAAGLLLTNSGYGRFGGMPGNVLLAYDVDAKR